MLQSARSLRLTVGQAVARLPGPAGEGWFVHEDARERFEDFSNDVTPWVMFYGPEASEPLES